MPVPLYVGNVTTPVVIYDSGLHVIHCIQTAFTSQLQLRNLAKLCRDEYKCLN